jgi:hypothetical protein
MKCAVVFTFALTWDNFFGLVIVITLTAQSYSNLLGNAFALRRGRGLIRRRILGRSSV